jgi:hypothetical protein
LSRRALAREALWRPHRRHPVRTRKFFLLVRKEKDVEAGTFKLTSKGSRGPLVPDQERDCNVQRLLIHGGAKALACGGILNHVNSYDEFGVQSFLRARGGVGRLLPMKRMLTFASPHS